MRLWIVLLTTSSFSRYDPHQNGEAWALKATKHREHIGRVTESKLYFIGHPMLTKLRVDDTFEQVRVPVVEIFEEREHEEFELNQTSDRDTFTTTVSVED